MPLLCLLTSVSDDDVTGVRGEHVDVSTEVAQRLLAAGVARPVDTARRTAVSGPPETR